MDSSVSMILPKGIVINTTNIYKEVASYSVLPADRIWKYWHVYTTTNKKLKDPTARRLENFWWQVWGSDRRNLSGRALARIYEDISVGPTFVPLHGPSNRWEGPDVQPLTKQFIVAQLNREAIGQHDHSGPTGIKSSDVLTRSLSSSTTKPSPSHPILKKSRIPLTIRPRPTARFASPPGTDDEHTKESDIPSSGSTATTGLEMAMQPKKPPPGTKMLIEASTRSSTPTLTPIRNQITHLKISPIPPTSVVQRVPEKPPPKQTQKAQKQMRLVPSILERSETQTNLESNMDQTDGCTGSFREPILSAKTAAKRPVAPRTAANDPYKASRQQSQPTLSTSSTISNSLAPNGSDLQPPISTRSMSLTRTETDNHSSTTGSYTDTSSTVGWPINQNGYARKSSSVQSLFTSATATTTNVAANGHIIDQAGSLPASSILDPQVNQISLASHPSATSLVDLRMAPTQPSPAASVPMGRTRSQLTLLLEREKTRVSDKSRFWN